MIAVGGGGGSRGLLGLLGSLRSRRERLVLEGMLMMLVFVACRRSRSAAAWGMKAWPSRLKGRTKGSTFEGISFMSI